MSGLNTTSTAAQAPAGKSTPGVSSAAILELPPLEALPRSIRALATRCVVVLSLYGAARTRRALTSQQRHVLLHVFSHLGEEGKLFIHQVLAQGPGYDPDSVNRQIHGVPPLPVGCSQIRRRLKLDAQRDGCNCVFRLDEDTYSNPLCHLDMFARAPSPILTRRPAPPDLDRDGRVVGYLSRLAKTFALKWGGG